MNKLKAGIIGCGAISGIYFKGGQTFEILDIIACADMYLDKAQEKAEEFHVLKACTVEELLADDEIQIVINLTVPQAHAKVSLAALEAGKHVYIEKPLAVTREDGRKILETAKKKGLLVGCAPDTFLGGGLQTCRKLIDDGLIGKPVASSSFMMKHGPENRHPNPESFYKQGGGPMFDMGPYYLTALISMMGPVREVTGSTSISFPERIITCQPKYGQKINVEIPTHIVGIMNFESGAVGSIITSFDAWITQLPWMEIYGTLGALQCPDPNTFGGSVLYKGIRDKDWREIPLTHGFTENSRGIGVADMAYAILSGRPHRANGEMAYHVLDIMHGFHDASRLGSHIQMTSTCIRPAQLPIGLSPLLLDE